MGEGLVKEEPREEVWEGGPVWGGLKGGVGGEVSVGTYGEIYCESVLHMCA